MSADDILRFAPFSSAVEATFWHALTTQKIDVYKLDDDLKDVLGYYSTGNYVSRDAGEAAISMPARLCLGSNAFFRNESSLRGIPPFSYPSVGQIKNTNTIEEFKQFDKTALFKRVADQIWQDIVSGDAVTQPHLLTRFLLITFADLKKYKFHFWFAFPALLADPPCALADQGGPRSVTEVWDADELEKLRVAYDTYRQEQTDGNAAFFLIKKKIEGGDDKKEFAVGRLQEWNSFFEGVDQNERIVGFADPSSMPANPGWPLRNFLVLLQHQWRVKQIKVFCFREIPGKKDISQSIFLKVKLPESISADETPKAVGWEKNPQGKLGPRTADLAPLMDPKQLADTSVDLNLKLMRWRIVPDLQLEKIKDTKCLLLGAGTLGCYVARNLLGWGVRNITFVDNSRVSFSNPVRQSLYAFEDCLNGGKPKAKTAAENLKTVYPGVNAEGYHLNVPMPGHPITNEAQTRADVEKLTQLIETHDVIFLLMDSRESRWLPTLLGASMKKLVINTALGFDTYLVMRHGVDDDENQTPAIGYDGTNLPHVKRLGCYFCNDVVAPTDSLKDRTLDQQCTVTRPGLSAIASAMAVELMISVLHHEKGPAAPADTAASQSKSSSTPLGIIPHQMRGFLAEFNNMIIVGQAYDKCTACSERVLKEYNVNGFEFLKSAFNSPSYLEELTGLSQLHEASENMDDFIWDDEDL
ncbi:236_t:CDS:10 [Paraglomus occultum]|uniref:Ubiquitin-like modifier-activating enzyme ATG7 n=1 Tax=Paraglomus occultum TaxID=144539 RepID=A0A9N8WIN9_9GLOM|nr:236_t:CDS:10 [Paraglomus occultum]